MRGQARQLRPFRWYGVVTLTAASLAVLALDTVATLDPVLAETKCVEQRMRRHAAVGEIVRQCSHPDVVALGVGDSASLAQLRVGQFQQVLIVLVRASFRRW